MSFPFFPVKIFFGLLILLVVCVPRVEARATTGENSEGWYLTLYRAQLSGDKLFETLTLQADLDREFWFWAVAVGKQIYQYSDDVVFEVEGQYVDHHGRQDHNEYNALFVVRWQNYSWDDVVKTTFAIGEGLSYASDIPVIEIESHDRATQWLNYLLFEATLSPSTSENWRFVARVHHRSGVFGAIGDIKGASNAIGLGVRYDFGP